MSKRLSERLRHSLLRLLGLLILALAICAAAFRAPERSLESLVARWAPPPSEFMELPLDGGQQLLHWRDEGPRGDPLPIVLLHGTSASLHTWAGWVKTLSATRRVITLDLPGFGLTGPAASGDYSDAAYLRLLLALLDRLELKQVILGGNSLGGQLAWEFAAQQPARVAALLLVDAGGLAFKPESVPLGFQLARIPGMRSLVSGFLPRRLIESSVRNVYGEPGQVTAELVDRYFELTLREGNRLALTQRFEQMRPGAYAARLGELRQPTLILWGRRDRLIPLEYGQQMKQAIKGSELVVFDTLGHVPQEEDPAATLKPVQAFCNRSNPDVRRRVDAATSSFFIFLTFSSIEESTTCNDVI